MDSTVNVQSDTKKDHNMIGDMIENKNKKKDIIRRQKKKRLAIRIYLIAYERCFKLHCDHNCCSLDF